MKTRLVVILALLAASAMGARTLNYVGDKNGLWSVATNWKDADGDTNAVPESGDTIYLNAVTGTKNDIPDFMPYMVKLKGYQTHNTSSLPIIFLDGSYGIYNEGYLHFDVPIKLEGTNITIYSSSTFVHRNKLCSWDGAECGIVKTGSSRAGINGQYCSSPSDFAGLKYVVIKAGQWLFGINGGASKMYLLPNDMTVTFDGANTRLGISQDCVFTNFCIRETAAARNKAHSIDCQVDGTADVKRGKLTICGAPPDDETVFTGSFETSVDFRWEPTSSAKSFVLSGRTSTTTGNVEVANGTMRLTEGATYSQLGLLALSGGANTRFVVDTPPAAAFHGKFLSLYTSGERLALSNGVTLTFHVARVNGSSVPAGTYSGVAAEGCTQASWIIGPGKVVVESGDGGYRLEWQGNYNGTWNSAANWKNLTTGESTSVPRNGDTLIFPKNKVNGQYVVPKNDITDLKPYRIELPTSYTSPNGNALTFEEGSWGIYNKGYMFYNIDTIVTASSINMYCSDMGGYKMGFHSPDGTPFRIVKTGSGIFGFMPDSADRSFVGMKYIDILEGKVVFGCQGGGMTDVFPAGMEITFGGANTSLQFGKDFTLDGLWIREDPSVVGQPHTIGCMASYLGSLTITGTPPVDSMPFTGTIENPVNFCWSPSSSAKEFVLKGSASISSTTGRIEVANGTIRFTEGASFTNLTWFTLSGGTGSRLVVDTETDYGPQAKILTLSTGNERVKLATGVALAVDSVTVGGVAVPAGVYCARANVGYTQVDWIEGGGLVCVGGATPLSPASGEAVAGEWTANGGSDTSIGNAANWGEPDNTVLPDLDGGTLNASFAAGSGAALDRDANFNGLSLAAPGSFALTAPDSTRYAILGEGGLATSGAGRAYTLSWPLFLAFDQTWTIAANDTLNVAGPIGGMGALEIKGGGTLNLNAATEMGPVSISNVTVNVNEDNAFGSCGEPVNINCSKRLTLNGVALGRGITDTCAAGTTSEIKIADNTDNVVEGDISFPNAPNVNWTIGANASLRVRGSIIRYKTNWCYFKGSGTLYLDSPLKVVRVNGSSSAFGFESNTIYFNAPSNDFGAVWFWIRGSNSRIFTTVPYAFITANAQIRDHGTRYSNNVWDMCGCDQGVKNLGFPQGGFTVTSASPATLHHAGTAYATTDVTNKVVFAGAVNLSYDGTGYHMFNAESTSTGIVQVTKGTCAFGPNGSWTNATRAVVTGGTLKLENNTAFGQTTEMDISGGTVDLGFSGTLHMGSLVVGGEPMNPGIYGAANNASVPARNRLSCLTGAGRLLIGDSIGTLLIFR